MISRDARGERIAYGCEADWWSFGCLGELKLVVKPDDREWAGRVI